VIVKEGVFMTQRAGPLVNFSQVLVLNVIKAAPEKVYVRDK
jgi:hypothetical protein